MSYEKALAETLLKHGILASAPEYYGGFEKYGKSYYVHMGAKDIEIGTPKCGGWLKLTHVSEEWDYQFNGTFNSDRTVHLVSGRVTCRCKKIKEKKVYYKGTFADLLRLTLGADINTFTGYNFQYDK